jgi:hypothetical protein
MMGEEYLLVNTIAIIIIRSDVDIHLHTIAVEIIHLISKGMRITQQQIIRENMLTINQGFFP